MIKKSIIKISAILLIIGLNWAGLSAMIETIAYYNDIEDSNTNTYQAEVLDFYLYSTTTNFVPPAVVSNMMPGDSVTREISVIKEENSNTFKYNIQTVMTGGDIDFCNALKLEAKLDGVIQYSDGLMSFVSATTTFSTSADDWLFTVTLPSGTSFPPGKVCQIKFVFNGWQINLPDSSSGFYDQEEIASSFATGGMKINKVYYNVDGEHGSEPANEWIEIYNPLDTPVDISGWKVCDNTSCDAIPTSDSIPAKGFAIITGSNTTWNYWNISNDIVKIVLADGEIGNGLANNGDRVILKMPDGTEDDAMSYGTDSYAFNPPCPDVAEGHILARVPTGFDTNTASDWKDLGLPEVTVTYPNGSTWHCNANYNLKWTATNPNGDKDNNKLTIDIIYITDNDKNGKISPGDKTFLIADDISNSGSYTWKIDFSKGYCFLGYVWIKVIATGPENFMVNNFGISNKVFEPPDPDLLDLQEACSSIDEYCGDSEELCLGLEEFCEAAKDYLPEEFLEDENTEAITSEEETTTTEETVPEAQTEEEISSEEELIIPEENNETGGETTEEIVNETTNETNETAGENTEESAPESTSSAPEETPANEEVPADETPMVEEQPATEEQPVALPNDDSSNQSTTGESGGDGGGDVSSGEGASTDSVAPSSDASNFGGDIAD